MSGIARTPQPPYYAVDFTAKRMLGDNGYGEMGELTSQQPGFRA